MNEHCTPEASHNTFDGDAISRADREFLASLGDHPLARHPLYSVPPPPRPDYEGCTTIADRQAAQETCFPAALDWMLVNYAYYTGAFMGKGGIISLVDGEDRNDRELARLYAALRDRERRPERAGSRRHPSSMTG